MSSDVETAKQLHAGGRLGEAEAAYRRALEADPGSLDARHHHAVLLMQTGRQPQAIDEFRQVLRAGPRYDALCAMALCCRATGAYAEGAGAAREAIGLRPADPLGWMLLGGLLVVLGDWVQGEQALKRAASLGPVSKDSLHYLGVALHRQQRWAEARDIYRRLLEASPGDARLLYNLGLCDEHLEDWAAAREHYALAHRHAPRRLDVLARLMHLCALVCDARGEREAYRALVDEASSGRARDADDRIDPFLLSFHDAPAAVVDQALAAAEAVALDEARHVQAGLPDSPVERRREGVLRLGYLSPDFGDHAVGQLMCEVFHAHDRGAVEVYGYSLRALPGEPAARIRAGFDVVHDCSGWSTPRIAQRIRADGIDVLYDLGGYTLGARPAVLAARPAPVQIGYLGFIHRQAARWLDGIVLDPTVLPEALRDAFGDRVFDVPGTMFPPGPAADAPPAADRARFGLPEDVPLLCSFNNAYKLDEALLAAWVAIGARLPDARFVVYAHATAADFLRATWRRRGGDAERLILVGKLPRALYRSRMASCDVFLDAFRYQGGATSVDAVRAGLPIVTLAGRRPLERMGASINAFLGMDELVADDVAGYVDRAVAAARDVVGLKARLRQALASSGFGDPRRIAAALEAIARKRYGQSLKPES